MSFHLKKIVAFTKVSDPIIYYPRTEQISDRRKVALLMYGEPNKLAIKNCASPKAPTSYNIATNS